MLSSSSLTTRPSSLAIRTTRLSSLSLSISSSRGQERATCSAINSKVRPAPTIQTRTHASSIQTTPSKEDSCLRMCTPPWRSNTNNKDDSSTHPLEVGSRKELRQSGDLHSHPITPRQSQQLLAQQTPKRNHLSDRLTKQRRTRRHLRQTYAKSSIPSKSWVMKPSLITCSSRLESMIYRGARRSVTTMSRSDKWKIFSLKSAKTSPNSK